jgi:hypothetical protein
MSEWGLEPFQGYMIRLDIHSLRICRLLAKTIGFEEKLEQKDVDKQSKLLKRFTYQLATWIDEFDKDFPAAEYVYADKTVIILGSNSKAGFEELASALQHALMECNLLAIRWDSVPEWFLTYRGNAR